jgi:signal transduction histidine kinase
VTPAAEKPPTPERELTDESLRVEREKADAAIGQYPTAVDDTADAVIETARARADAVVARARAKSDVQSAPPASDAPPPSTVARERLLQDETLRRERADADETLRTERAEHAAGLAVERDETDHDLSQERARSDRAVATRDEFLGVVSHDLTNMLSAMVGFAALIVKAESRPDHGAEVIAHAQRVQRAGARMKRLIGDLVDVASIEVGRLAVTREVGDPVPVVTEAVEALHSQASASGVSLAAEIVPPLPPLAFDSARLFQVLLNLISNALKFTPNGGNVVVRVEHVGEYVRFSIHDSGVGIPAERLEAVFERFMQVHDDRRGMGLGLYIAKCIVEGHDGKIWAESTVGEGSTFSFTLPVRVPAPLPFRS